MPPRSPRVLERGRLSALLDGADLRYVSVDGVEVLRRVYVTVRDADWDIPPVVFLDVVLEESADAIVVRAVAEQRSATADAAWEATATLRGDGTLDYAVTVSPRAAFPFSRIGLCLLHPPATCAGRSYRARDDAAQVAGALPELIAPQLVDGGEIFPLFAAFQALEIDVRGLGACRFAFEGERFEMEDQRNWSDGSFKTYCTPLSEPRPRQARPGETVAQAIRLAPPSAAAAVAARHAHRDRGPVELRVGERTALAVPQLGLGLGEPLGEDTGSAIRALAPEHLRVDLRHPDRFGAVLAQAAADSRLVGCPVVLALHLGARPADELAALARRMSATALDVLRVLAFSRDQPASSGPLVQQAQSQLAPLLPGAAFAGGTDAWFVDLNRGRPEARAMDAVAWSVTPQVHAYDELTMVEAIEAQTDQAVTARSFSPGLDLLPGPITLRARYNPNAADAARQALDHPPASIDPRQASPFAAAWTAASVRAQALGAVRAVTYFETAGPRGVVAGDGSVLPCWHPLRWARACTGWSVLETTSSALLVAQTFVVCDPRARAVRGLVVNLTATRQRVRVGGLQAERLRCSPLGAAPADVLVARDGFLEGELAPWAVHAFESA